MNEVERRRDPKTQKARTRKVPRHNQLRSLREQKYEVVEEPRTL
jgi:hypothetical protein